MIGLGVTFGVRLSDLWDFLYSQIESSLFNYGAYLKPWLEWWNEAIKNMVDWSCDRNKGIFGVTRLKLMPIASFQLRELKSFLKELMRTFRVQWIYNRIGKEKK